MTHANAKTIREIQGAILDTGVAVVEQREASNGGYMLDEGRTAQRASSCLVLPQQGDTVVWLKMGDGAVLITHVLRRRQGGAPLRVSLPAGTVIETETGSLELSADVLALRTRALSVEGEQAHLAVEQVTAVGRKASWSFGVIRLTAELVESFAERMLQFSRWSQRLVDGPDLVRSRQIDWRAEQTLQMQAQVVITSADKLLKADSEQIHLG